MSGRTTTATQPRPAYSGVDAHRGACGQESFIATPATAPLHTVARIAAWTVPRSTSTANGVYVPAMNRKIIEWSRRRMTAHPRAVHLRRWYRALTPNTPQTVRL